ncbi:MAG: hypothetical protein EON60_06900 [Alphaproteobacteria bacterium]|nr:MAG: hypothetical protein EON60_06900 [Alphaproteobacteria bacterium]
MVKKSILILLAVLVIGAGGVWAYAYYLAHNYTQNVSCTDFTTGIEDLVTNADTSTDNIRNANVAIAGSTVLAYASIRVSATSPISSMDAAPVPFTAYNQLASMCKAKPEFKIWQFILANQQLAKSNPDAANAALDKELEGITVEQHPAGTVYARILGAIHKASPTMSPTTETAE